MVYLIIADEESYTAIEYDFLVNGSLLRKTLGELVDSLELNKVCNLVYQIKRCNYCYFVNYYG